MKVSLLDYTGNGNPDPWHPVNILIFTKSTRLNMLPGLLAEIAAWPEEKKLEELNYMARTIPSSWEFCDYTFIIEGVTRAFTHQFVRSRTWSFAQQTMRTLNVSGWEYGTGPTILNDPARRAFYDGTMRSIAKSYSELVKDGAAIEDARGLLPTNILTNIVGKANMRNFVDLVHKRSSLRVQDEYRAVLQAMVDEVLRVHPWMHLFLNRTSDTAAKELASVIEGWRSKGLIKNEEAVAAQKNLDRLRSST